MSAPSWLILLYTLPASRSAARLSFWRQLKRIGAVSLKTSAYILPQRPEHAESLQWLAQQIRQEGGEATLLRAATVDTLAPTEVIDLFQAARRDDYSEILAAALRLKRPAKVQSGERPADIAAEVERLKRRFLAVQKIDFFHCPEGVRVRQALDALTPSKHAAQRGRAVKAANYQELRWQTRPRPELDRVASAWLIRKFIDPKATFVFSAERGSHRGAVTFDMVDADFGHEGDECTFETLLRRFSLKAPGLAEVAEVVHAADLDDGKFPRTEGSGLLAVLRGWAIQGLADEEILRRGFDLIEGLHQSLKGR
jgi:hypothetical protein